METFRVTSVLLFFVVGAILSFPSRPLNERSTELAWQAWLLVDDQNQNRQNDPDGVLRRRITPKSIFIAPTFSPETLPACAEGYRSDSMGRCINIIQIDADAHLNFLLEKLNEKFGKPSEFEEENSQENSPTTGPFQFNIPLDSEDDDDDSKEISEENVDVAIVVAPTNGNFDIENDSVKVNVKRTNNKTDSGTKTVSVEKSTTVGSDSSGDELLVVNTESTTEPPTTTTTEALETTETTTTVQEQTTQQALFFWEPLETLSKTEHVQNGTNDAKEDTPNKRDSIDNKKVREPLTTTILEDDDFFTTTTLTSPVRFPMNPTKPSSSQTIIYENHHQLQQQLQKRPNDYQIVIDDPIIVSNQGSLALDPQPQSQYGSSNNAHHVYNHRNRDKHTSLWFRPSSLQKQLLLKMPRKSSSSSSSSSSYPRYENANIHDSIYRELQPDELSYIFGTGRRRRNHR